MGRTGVAVVFALALGACFTKPERFGDRSDAGTDDSGIDGTGSCTAMSATCVTANVLETCAGAGASPEVATCSWGCTATGTTRCLRIAPLGGGVAATDLDPSPDLLDATLAGVIDGSTGEISGFAARMPGTGVHAGIGYAVQGGVAVFRFKSLVISGTLELRGTNAIALVADGPITINAVIDGTIACSMTAARGAGGSAGGVPGAPASGNGAGAAGTAQSHGGGGGGHGLVGGNGGAMNGTAPAGGAAFAFTALRGGGGGGGGNNTTGPGGAGGGGGAALQIVSNATITVGAAGGINAGGCGGRGTSSGSPGGGGGAGGVIVIEARDVTIAGSLAVNGGGGGAGDVDGGHGEHGLLDRDIASGGSAMTGIGNGGGGGFGIASPATTLQGQPGAGSSRSGGGGGGIGRIRINTESGNVTVTGLMSPAFADAGTTATKSSLVVQ